MQKDRKGSSLLGGGGIGELRRGCPQEDEFPKPKRGDNVPAAAVQGSFCTEKPDSRGGGDVKKKSYTRKKTSSEREFVINKTLEEPKKDSLERYYGKRKGREKAAGADREYTESEKKNLPVEGPIHKWSMYPTGKREKRAFQKKSKKIYWKPKEYAGRKKHSRETLQVRRGALRGGGGMKTHSCRGQVVRRT